MKGFLYIAAALLLASLHLRAQDDGYNLWLNYRPLGKQSSDLYQREFRGWIVDSDTPTGAIAKNELRRAFSALFSDTVMRELTTPLRVPRIVFGTTRSPMLSRFAEKAKGISDEGFVFFRGDINGSKSLIVLSQGEAGMLYGMFHLLRLIQTGAEIRELKSSPKTKIRILNHWDNLDRTVERGYAGFSLWDWHKLPEHIDPRYHDYARANASIGINATVLTNVNANALILTPHYLEKVKALADVFRPYGIKVYLTARFSAPIEIGGLPTADPADNRVRQWWKDKAREIYQYIPDFGGFTVKANSEGQPGPQNYGRNHADGANMLAEALKPFNGIVMWRAFVYDHNVPDDRTKQAYNEFKHLDGKFLPNVMVQVKNGPLDFQPREPFHPLFGAMPATSLLPEFQITQEYLGFATHLFYQAPLFKECLQSDTYARGKGSTVARVMDGTLDNHTLTGVAGVANIGNDRNWCGHPIAQSNWYAFGRLAWDHGLSPESIADEWIAMTFGDNAEVIRTLREMMIASREITVLYMTPLGLHHIMGWSHHYGPAPWIKDKERADWTSVYYHRADEKGIGFDRTKKGSNALEQYHPSVREKFEDAKRTPDEFLLWFHRVEWDYRMPSAQTLWDAMCLSYQQGVDSVKWMQAQWKSLDGKIDPAIHAHVQSLLRIQYMEAEWWRDACLLYFQQFSKRPLPKGVAKPARTLEYYQSLEFPFAPGIRPRWG
jgi:alpha-glucuronidase